MKLAAYDFEVIHMAGDKIPCHYGSRAGCPKQTGFTPEEAERMGVEDDSEIYVNRVVDEQLPQAVTRDILRKAIAEDKTMQMLITDVQKGMCRKALTSISAGVPRAHGGGRAGPERRAADHTGGVAGDSGAAGT